jgi:hypothetical protein
MPLNMKSISGSGYRRLVLALVLIIQQAVTLKAGTLLSADYDSQ